MVKVILMLSLLFYYFIYCILILVIAEFFLYTTVGYMYLVFCVFLFRMSYQCSLLLFMIRFLHLFSNYFQIILILRHINNPLKSYTVRYSCFLFAFYFYSLDIKYFFSAAHTTKVCKCCFAAGKITLDM